MSSLQKKVRDDVWHRSPNVVRLFVEQQELYRHLCDEVEALARWVCKELKIPYYSVTSRTKDLGSFVEKIERKAYADPFQDNTDFAGVRIVCRLQDEVENVTEKLRSIFNVHDDEDKKDRLADDQFGYRAKHLIVSLKNGYYSPSAAPITEMKCEIQIRTVFQDAWALLQHSIVYKNESKTPPEIRRSISRLAALMEIGDDVYARLVDDIEANKSVLKTRVRTKQILDEDIYVDSIEATLENLDELVNGSPSNRHIEYQRGQSQRIFELLYELKTESVKNSFKLDKVRDLVSLVRECWRDLEQFAVNNDLQFQDIPSCQLVGIALALRSNDLLNQLNFPDQWKKSISLLIEAKALSSVEAENKASNFEGNASPSH
jgi:ppGpp synthetase/RelA/SpoT-type nucleotidyltranferase